MASTSTQNGGAVMVLKGAKGAMTPEPRRAPHLRDHIERFSIQTYERKEGNHE